MSASHYYMLYQHRQYCIHVDYVFIEKSCPVEMRIYEGLNSWHKIPKVVSKIVDEDLFKCHYFLLL